MKRPAPLDAHRLRELAVAAVCDPRTASKFLSGGQVRPTVRARITAALERLGLGDLAREDAPR